MTTQEILQGVHDWTNGKIVYDISVAHPDGQGNPTKYANLTAALGTGGANIPEALRKGGMSIKFVLSSDNKYIQYMFMLSGSFTDAQFANAANWRGTVDIPAPTKTDIVSSKGIFYSLVNSELAQQEEHLLTYSLALTELNTLPIVFNSSRKVVYAPTSSYVGYILRLQAGVTYRFTKGANFSLFENIPQVGDDGSDTYISNGGYITVPTNSLYKFALIVIAKTDFDKFAIYIDSDSIPLFIERIKVSNMNAFRNQEYNITGIVKPDGSIVDGSDAQFYRRTDYILVSEGTIIRGYDEKTSSGLTNKLVSFFDEDKEFISNLTFADTGMNTAVLSDSNIPANAKYFIACIHNDYIKESSVLVYMPSEYNALYNENKETIASLNTRIGQVDTKVDNTNTRITNELYGIYKIQNSTSNHKRIAIWVDDTPNLETYKIRIDADDPSIEKFSIYKGTSAHSGLVSILNNANFGEVYEITKDVDKPSLYIYNSSAPDETTTDRDYVITLYNQYYDNSFNTRVEKLEEQESIGEWVGKTIVCFGDSLSEFGDADAKQWTYYMEQLTGANVINVAIGGTSFAQRRAEIPVFDSSESYAQGDMVFIEQSDLIKLYSFNSAHTGAWTGTDVTERPYLGTYGYCNLDIYSLVKAACDTTTPIASRFLKQKYAARYVAQNSYDRNNLAIIERLEAIDWSKVNAVVMFAGVNDWRNRVDHWGNTGSTNPLETLGAINEIISSILSVYPYVQLYWFTPVVAWAGYPTTHNVEDFSDNEAIGTVDTKTLKQFSAMIEDEVVLNHIPICDLYNTLGWNMSNFSFYFDGEDGTHPKNGIKYLGRKITAFIKANKTF